jgi:hypothetical protein
MNTLHDQDFHLWASQQAHLLRSGRLHDLDVDDLIEELEEMSGSHRRELINRLGVLIAHLLKWQFQPTARSSSWVGTIKEQRRKLNRLLRENPSLKNITPDKISDAYGDALAIVEKDTGLNETNFPELCPFTIVQILDESFWSA